MEHMTQCPTCCGSGRISSTDLAARLEREGKTGASHPATSRQAGTTPRKGSQRLAVLLTLSHRGPLTARQIAQSLDRSPNQTATRLLELHEDGFVTFALDDLGEIKTRATTNGNTGRVHEITSLGEAAIERAGRPAPTLYRRLS